MVRVIPEGESPAVSVISYYEIMAGIQRLKSPREEKFFRKFFSDIEILELTIPSAEIAGEIGARMASRGNRVNTLDILIAGIAIANHARSIITADTDFQEISKYCGIDVIFYNRTGATS